MASTSSTPSVKQRDHTPFLKRYGAPPDVTSTFLAGDFSNRTYYRLRTSQDWFAPQVILMDAPPPQEDIQPFLTVANLLTTHGIRTPKIYAFDHNEGLMLLEDFGDTTYKRALYQNSQKDKLYKNALDVLLKIQHIPQTHELRSLDIPTLVGELNSFFAWALPHPLSETDKKEAQDLWAQALAPIALLNQSQPTLVLLDYHVENLMIPPTRESYGLLDFQDARWGTQAYDVVSLLQDARIDVDPQMEKDLKHYYLNHQTPKFDKDAFHLGYTLLGVQRSTRILGLFIRRARADKPEMRHHLPRVFNHIWRGLNTEACQELKRWFLHQGFQQDWSDDIAN